MVSVYNAIFQDPVFKPLSDFVVRSNLNVCHHPIKFGGHKHCGSEDITALLCHVISQDHVIKGSCDFMCRSPSK